MKPKNKNEKLALSVKLFELEKVSVHGFCNFCKNNTLLVIAVTVALFFTYGVRLFWYNIGGPDTELFMADKSGVLLWAAQTGRFGYALLAKLWHINEFNPFTAFFVTFCLIWFFTISWCYIIAIFNGDTAGDKKLIPFALVLMTMPIWAETFSHLHQSAEFALIISLCPYTIYLLYKGLLDDEKGKVACGFVLLLFMTSVYQAIVPMFFCGALACFLLLQEQMNYKPRVYLNFSLKFCITMAVSLATYLIIDRGVLPVVFGIERAGYLDKMNVWGSVSFRENIYRVFGLGYTITIGRIPFMQNIMDSIMASQVPLKGGSAAEYVAGLSRAFSNVLLLPVTALFLVKAGAIAHKAIPAGRRLLYALAVAGVPLCIMILSFAGGKNQPIRTLYALPLAFAFMFFFLIKKYKKKAATVVFCLAVLTAAHQAQNTAQLFYSDYLRYNEDIRLVTGLGDLIAQVQPEGEKLPVALVGIYRTSSRSNPNFLHGELLGFSLFEISRSVFETSRRGLTFMSIQGIDFDIPNEDQAERALKEAERMPAYPDPNSIRRMEDFIVVKISDELY
ncbi:MAG: glucosyltransferase domain-containing protein [Chitinispirillales bacterium]|jgi:uncharacterized protein (DUF983 family)|nr:glucosyltransferase domain-containing protein [Chitinispirillales bacterium]